MTIEDYKKQLCLLESKFEQDCNKLIKQYCDANNPYKIGDKFTDHIGTIIIEKMGYQHGRSGMCCVYQGAELKKDGTLRKDGAKRHAWQSNDISTKL